MTKLSPSLFLPLPIPHLHRTLFYTRCCTIDPFPLTARVSPSTVTPNFRPKTRESSRPFWPTPLVSSRARHLEIRRSTARVSCTTSLSGRSISAQGPIKPLFVCLLISLSVSDLPPSILQWRTSPLLPHLLRPRARRRVLDYDSPIFLPFPASTSFCHCRVGLTGRIIFAFIFVMSPSIRLVPRTLSSSLHDSCMNSLYDCPCFPSRVLESSGSRPQLFSSFSLNLLLDLYRTWGFMGLIYGARRYCI